MAAEVYHNMFLTDIQAIWHWDLTGDGSGEYSDAQLDALLAHLRVGPRSRTVGASRLRRSE